MTGIKIKSNPYLQQIIFQRTVGEGLWEDISIETDPNSQLLNDDIRSGFFPFIVKRIIDILLREYSDSDESLSIVFEGTGDEFSVLKSVCDEEQYACRIILTKSEISLENAQEILPRIGEIFREVQGLISSAGLDESDELNRGVRKFYDASSDSIPICVFGTYSTGKSTFINALIGYDLLPCGDNPVTGKIYKITNTGDAYEGTVEFYNGDNAISITLFGDHFKFTKGEMGSELGRRIYEALTELDKNSVTAQARKIISTIEMYVKEFENENEVSDLIEIAIPFGKGIWSTTRKNFVIFDTPGSNSATNIDHVRVLKKAMEDMSNGMPVFVTDAKTIDSIDNVKLYKEIIAMQELDRRFTMIVINKADDADIEEEDGRVGLSAAKEQQYLNYSVVKMFYGDGIFFISSIAALGSKTNGEFEYSHNAKMFRRINKDYCNQDDSLNDRLYRFDIMPEHLKRKAIENAELQNDKLYVNSGLYTIEDEISNFGRKYSSYNKCYQSELFLRRVIDITSEEIQTRKKQKEYFKQRRLDNLDKDKKQLVETIKRENTAKLDEYRNAYHSYMQTFRQEVSKNAHISDLYNTRQEYLEIQKAELRVADYENRRAQAEEDIFDHFTYGVRNVWDKKKLTGLIEIGRSFFIDLKKVRDEGAQVAKVREKVQRRADMNVTDKLKSDFVQFSYQATEILYDKSKEYWNRKTNEIKEDLSQIVAGTTALTPERRSELAKIIINYQNIDYFLNKKLLKDDKFSADMFRRKFLFWNTKDLDLEKLTEEFNNSISKTIYETCDSVKKSHFKSYEDWSDALEELIFEKIEDYNPELRSHNAEIKDLTKEINRLESLQLKLDDLTNEISDMMKWKA